MIPQNIYIFSISYITGQTVGREQGEPESGERVPARSTSDVRTTRVTGHPFVTPRQ